MSKKVECNIVVVAGTRLDKYTLLASDPDASYEFRHIVLGPIQWNVLEANTPALVLLSEDYVIRKIVVKLSPEDRLRGMIKDLYSLVMTEKPWPSWDKSNTKKVMEAIK